MREIITQLSRTPLMHSIDNGVNISSSGTNYAVRTDLSSRIKRVNPNWNEACDDVGYDAS
jgi:hypothetical protein